MTLTYPTVSYGSQEQKLSSEGLSRRVAGGLWKPAASEYWQIERPVGTHGAPWARSRGETGLLRLRVARRRTTLVTCHSAFQGITYAL